MTTDPTRENTADFAVRDRLLLYLSGLGVESVASLELAAESLRRAGPGASHARAMARLREVLEEAGFELPRPGTPVRLRSYPRHNRKAMVSRGVEYPGIYGSVKRLASGMLRLCTAGLIRPLGRKGA